MLTYKRFDHVEVIGYSDSDLPDVLTRNPCLDTCPFLLEGSFMEEYESVCHFCIHYRDWVCGMLWGHYSKVMVAELYFKTWDCWWSRQPLKIYCGNSATVFFFKNDNYSKGAKHMEIKDFVVKKNFRNKECRLSTSAPIL